MAGKHARLAPLVVSRALATLVASALLLAVGVVAVTVFTGGERPATGGPRPGAQAGATGPTAAPTATGDSATRGAGASGAPSATGTGDLVDLATSGGSGTAPAGMPPSSPTSTGSPSSGAASSASLPGVVPGVVTWPSGWAQRSDAGRAHGNALGLLRRVAAGHGCRRVPSKAKPFAAYPEPVSCR